MLCIWCQSCRIWHQDHCVCSMTSWQVTAAWKTTRPASMSWQQEWHGGGQIKMWNAVLNLLFVLMERLYITTSTRTQHPNYNLPITNGSACLPVNKSALSYFQSTASYLSVTLRWAPSECTRVIKKAAERGGWWWWCSWWCHLTCAFACDVQATLWKNRLCRNVEVIQHNCNRWHRQREAMSAKHDSSVSVSAQAACFDTNLWQQHISGGDKSLTEAAASVSQEKRGTRLHF